MISESVAGMLVAVFRAEIREFSFIFRVIRGFSSLSSVRRKE